MIEVEMPEGLDSLVPRGEVCPRAVPVREQVFAFGAGWPGRIVPQMSSFPELPRTSGSYATLFCTHFHCYRWTCMSASCAAVAVMRTGFSCVTGVMTVTTPFA